MPRKRQTLQGESYKKITDYFRSEPAKQPNNSNTSPFSPEPEHTNAFSSELDLSDFEVSPAPRLLRRLRRGDESLVEQELPVRLLPRGDAEEVECDYRAFVSNCDSSWLKRVTERLRERSVGGGTFKKLKEEWFITREYKDNKVPEISCGLCDHPRIRYEFQIKNYYNGETLWLGSTCIRQFVEAGLRLMGLNNEQIFLAKKDTLEFIDNVIREGQEASNAATYFILR